MSNISRRQQKSFNKNDWQHSNFGPDLYNAFEKSLDLRLDCIWFLTKYQKLSVGRYFIYLYWGIFFFTKYKYICLRYLWSIAFISLWGETIRRGSKTPRNRRKNGGVADSSTPAAAAEECRRDRARVGGVRMKNRLQTRRRTRRESA